MSDTILVIGATGAMGRPVVHALLSEPGRTVRVFTRDPGSRQARALVEAGQGRVEAAIGNVDDEASLAGAMTGVAGVFCNTDFFSTASPLKEYDQGLRVLRAAQAARVGHFVWSSLDNAAVLTDGRIPVPHYDAKAAVEARIGLMRSDEFMRQEMDGWFSHHVTVLVTGPYFENLQSFAVPQPGMLADGRTGMVFNIPLGAGRWPMIALNDIAWFAKRVLDDRGQWGGRTLRVLSEALSGEEIAAAFERITDIPAEYRDVPLDAVRASMPGIGLDLAAMWQFFQEFDLIGRERDIASLRRMHPGLLRFEDWLRTSGWRGEPAEVQKRA